MNGDGTQYEQVIHYDQYLNILKGYVPQDVTVIGARIPLQDDPRGYLASKSGRDGDHENM